MGILEGQGKRRCHFLLGQLWLPTWYRSTYGTFEVMSSRGLPRRRGCCPLWHGDSSHLSLSLCFGSCRIQTGRLSDFLTTSCRTHLSFMDAGLEGKLYADDYGLSLESFRDLDHEDWMHGFQLAEDGKEMGPPLLPALECAVVRNAGPLNPDSNNSLLAGA